MSQAGNFFEDFAPGQVIRHALGRTVFERNIMVYKRAHAPQGELVPAPNIPGQ